MRYTDKVLGLIMPHQLEYMFHRPDWLIFCRLRRVYIYINWWVWLLWQTMWFAKHDQRVVLVIVKIHYHNAV